MVVRALYKMTLFTIIIINNITSFKPSPLLQLHFGWMIITWARSSTVDPVMSPNYQPPFFRNGKRHDTTFDGGGDFSRNRLISDALESSPSIVIWVVGKFASKEPCKWAWMVAENENPIRVTVSWERNQKWVVRLHRNSRDETKCEA